ncbi:MAG: sigma factor-like helix-turn-helix DNA-binding protein [Patescibacteria group bacterium]
MDNLPLSQPDHQELPESNDSVLKRVLLETESQEKNAARPFKLINNILSGLRNRERDVLSARYGLISDKSAKETLESIGRRFSVTRERVRQIETAALKKVSKKYTGQLKPLVKLINAYLLTQGGVADMEGLVAQLNLADITAEAEMDRRALRLIMEAYDKVRSLKKQPMFKEGWAVTTVNQEELIKIQSTIQQVLKEVNQPLAESELIKKVVERIPAVSVSLVAGVLRINPKISLDNKNHWGLMTWPLVSPRRIRDKVFLVLEAAGKPLHFEKITQLISGKYPSEKKVLSRTVHNELIGDDRFVLVGRGIYALKRWGYQPGVVADVIKDILSQTNRPMQVAEIITEVLKRRQVKKNTIVANLQNRRWFRKVAKSTYALATTSPDSSGSSPE